MPSTRGRRVFALTVQCILLLLIACVATEDVLLDWYHDAESANSLPDQTENHSTPVLLHSATTTATHGDTKSTIVSHAAPERAKGILEEINYARTNPLAYAALVESDNSPIVNRLAPKGSAQRKEAVLFLTSLSRRKLNKLSWNEKLCAVGASRMQSSQSQRNQERVETRWRQAKCYYRESLAAGSALPREVVISWILDVASAQRQNRRTLFNQKAVSACTLTTGNSKHSSPISGFYSRDRSCYGYEFGQLLNKEAPADLQFAVDLMREVNFARTDPKRYAQLVASYSSHVVDHSAPLSSPQRKETIKFLNNVPALRTLALRNVLCRYGQQHLNKLVASNSFSHGDMRARWVQAKCMFRETLAAGEASVRDYVMTWIIDTQDPTKSNRKNVFDPNAVSGCVAQGSGANYAYKRVVAFYTRENRCHGFNK